MVAVRTQNPKARLWRTTRPSMLIGLSPFSMNWLVSIQTPPSFVRRVNWRGLASASNPITKTVPSVIHTIDCQFGADGTNARVIAAPTSSNIPNRRQWRSIRSSMLISLSSFLKNGLVSIQIPPSAARLANHRGLRRAMRLMQPAIVSPIHAIYCQVATGTTRSCSLMGYSLCEGGS